MTTFNSDVKEMSIQLYNTLCMWCYGLQDYVVDNKVYNIHVYTSLEYASNYFKLVGFGIKALTKRLLYIIVSRTKKIDVRYVRKHAKIYKKLYHVDYFISLARGNAISHGQLGKYQNEAHGEIYFYFTTHQVR